MPKKLLSTGAVATGIVLGLPALPAGAAGGPDTSGRAFVEVDITDDVEEDIEDFCGVEGLTVDIHNDITFRGFATFHGPESVLYFHGTFHQRTTVIEEDGTTVTYSGGGVQHDLRIEVDGDLLDITGMAAGGFRVVGPEATLRDPGMVFFRFIVDSNGTLQDPDDDTLVEDFGLLRESTGLNEAVEFCADYLTVTGRA